METLSVRPALHDDAQSISVLIRGAAHYFTLQPNGEGAEQVLLGMTPDAIANYIRNPSFNYLVAVIDKQLAGVVAVRDGTHLFHLFVQTEFQRNGIALRLWQAAKSQAIAAGNTIGFTVNSTLYAVPVYQRFGFCATGSKVEKNGIAFVPMVLALANERG